MTDPLDALLNGPPDDVDDGSEPTNRRGPKVATPAQVVSLAKRTLRQLYLGEVKPHLGLAVLSGCKITLDLMDRHQEPVDPLSDEGVSDERQLAVIRRAQHDALKKHHQQENEHRAQMIQKARAELGDDAAKFLEQHLPVAGRTRPYTGPTPRTTSGPGRAVARQRVEIEENENQRDALELVEPTLTVDALLRDRPGSTQPEEW